MTIVLVDGGEVEAGLGWSAFTHSPGTAPSAPQALAADNGANSADIVVTWTEPADKGGWSTIEGYEVELTTVASQEFMPALTANNAPAPYVVSASGVLVANTYEPWKAFDDVYVPADPINQTKGWYSQDSAPPWWLKIDLGSQRQIVGFYWSKTMTTNPYAVDHFPKAWQLQGSNDNSTWTTVHSETAYAMSGTGFDMYVPVSTPGSYRYYRWWITDCQAAGSTHVGLDEIRLVEQNNWIDFMPAMTASNAPTPYVVSASSEFSTDYAGWCAFADIVNGANGWFSANTGQPWWLKIDLGLPRKVEAFQWSPYRLDSYGYANFPKDWQFQGSTDNVNWTTLVSATNYTLSANNTQVDVENDTAYRYYRWYVTRTDDGGYCLIADIRLLERNEPLVEVEVQTHTSSPITFPDKAFGKTYSIRARAKNIVGWSVWTSLIQYTHTA